MQFTTDEEVKSNRKIILKQLHKGANPISLRDIEHFVTWKTPEQLKYIANLLIEANTQRNDD